jgi:hypothetical protein
MKRNKIMQKRDGVGCQRWRMQGKKPRNPEKIRTLMKRQNGGRGWVEE